MIIIISNVSLYLRFFIRREYSVLISELEEQINWVKGRRRSFLFLRIIISMDEGLF